MCGIVGAMALGNLGERQEKLRQESMIYLTTELLQLTQARGTDATGVSILFNDGNFMGLKMGISSPEFISRYGGKGTDFEGFLKVWRDNKYPVKTYLGHCRKISVGSAVNNSNNHPIKVGNIVGIHNGTIDNHNTIFDRLKCKRDGDVDSEAIMRLLHFYTRKGSDPFTPEMVKEVCLRLQGTYSVIAYNADNINQIVTFRDSKPAIAALIKPLNLLLVASEDSYIKQALYRYNKHTKLYQPRIKFPMIKKEDIHIFTMLDDTCAVFDLENKATKDTTVNDLFESVKVLRLDKLWKKGTNYNQNFGNSTKKPHNTVAEHNRKALAEANKKTAAAEKSKPKAAKNNKGKIWNKNLKEFNDVDASEEVAAKKIKSVEIESDGTLNHIEDGEITKPKPKKDLIILNIVPREKVNGLVGDTAKVHDEPVDSSCCTEENTTIVNPSTGNVTGRKKPIGTTVEVNTNINPDAMEAAVMAASVQPKFESDDEVLEELDIVDILELKNLQLFALTNRISKMVYKKSYYKGFVKSNEKIAKAEKNIKTLKKVAKIFMEALCRTNYNTSWKKEYIKKASDKEEDITIDDLQRVFSVGDLRENDELRYLRDKCTKK